MLLGHSMAIRTLDSAAEGEDRQEVSTSVDSAAERSTSSAPQSRQSTPAEERNSPLGAVVVSRWINHSTPLQPESSDDRQKLPFSADCNDRVQDLLDSRGGPTSQSAGGLRDTTTKSEYRPAEKMTRDPRGDWIPRQDDRPIVRPKDNKPDWSRLEGSAGATVCDSPTPHGWESWPEYEPWPVSHGTPRKNGGAWEAFAAG